jgi:hypothetical protein
MAISVTRFGIRFLNEYRRELLPSPVVEIELEKAGFSR